MARIDLPTNPVELIELAKKVKDKHLLDGTNSPLNVISTEVDWSALDGSLDKCKALGEKAQELSRQVEQLYEERDLLLRPVNEAVKKSRNLLKNAYPSNPKKLGEWGFQVVS